jgi:hypothetical protein
VREGIIPLPSRSPGQENDVREWQNAHVIVPMTSALAQPATRIAQEGRRVDARQSKSLPKCSARCNDSAPFLVPPHRLRNVRADVLRDLN